MKNTQRGFIMPLLLAIIAILLVGGGAYVYTQNKQGHQSETVTPTNQTTSTAQTADWKTYTNQQYGFEFKYPATYVAMQTKNGILLTSSNVKGGNITFVISPISNGKTLNINCQPSGSEDVNSIVDGFHSAECKNLENASGVRYTRGVNAGMSTAQTYKEQILKGYFLDSKESVIIQTTLVDAAGNTLPMATSVFDGILQSIKFVAQPTAQVSSSQPVKSYTISQCGMTLTVKTNQTVKTFGAENTITVRRSAGDISTMKPELAVYCQAINKNPQTNLDNLLNDVSYSISIQSDGSNVVNKNDYRVFDDQTITSITKLYSAKNWGYQEGSEVIGFETKDWIYTFRFLNPTQAKNQDTFVISVVTPTVSSSQTAGVVTISGPTSLAVGQTGTWEVTRQGATRFAVIWADGTPVNVGEASGKPYDSEYTTSPSFTHSFSKPGTYFVQFFAKILDGTDNMVAKGVEITVR